MMIGNSTAYLNRIPPNSNVGSVRDTFFGNLFDGRLLVRRAKLVGRPQEAIGHEIKILRILNGNVVVAERGVEHAGAVVVVRPHDNRRFRFVLQFLRAASESLGGLEDFDIVVKLFVAGLPVGQALRDGVVFVEIRDADRQLRTVAGRFNADEFEPVAFARAIRVHGTMQVDGRQAFFVGSENVAHGLGVFYVGATFVVNHDVVAFGPVGLFVHFEFGFGRFVGRVNHGDFDVRPGLDALLQDFRLGFVIVAAAAENQERLQGFGVFGKQR